MKRCIVISDSFKGSLSSLEICDLAQGAIGRIFPRCQVVALPVADGGEGTVDSFLHALPQAQSVQVQVTGPYGESVTANYARSGDTAIVEMAAAAGLTMVEGRRDPAATTTYGVGELMRHAVEHGARRLVLGLGGSATNDGGCGAAAALGTVFTDWAGRPFRPVGGTLSQIVGIDLAPVARLLAEVEITAMCDIDNPLHGPQGAAYIFAPQKGAGPRQVEELDGQLRALDRIIQSQLGLSVAQRPGAGAAGGFGAGCLAFFGARLQSGIEAVLDMVEFDRLLEGCDLVFTGEGRLDGQSLRGKVISGVAARAKAKGVPVVVIAGAVLDDAYDAYDLGVSAVFSTNRLCLPFPEVRDRSRLDYIHTLEDVLRLIRAVVPTES